MNFAGLCTVGRLADGPLFYLSDLARNANDDPRMDQHLAAMRLLNEVVQHPFGNFEVGDHTIFHRAYGDNISGRPAKHVFGLPAHRLDFTRVLLARDDTGLVYDNALAFGEHQGVRSPQIDSKI